MSIPPSDLSDIHYPMVVAALEQYPLNTWDVVFLRHNENLVYRVIEHSSGNQYLLRIHYPRHVGFRGIQQRKLAIESELAWLRAINDDTELLVQQPIPNLHGEFVTMIVGPSDATELPCTLLTWIDAQQFSQDDSKAATLARRLGALHARLHAHTCTWIVPQPFLRLEYDVPILEHALGNLNAGIQNDIITSGDAELVVEAGDYISCLLKSLERTRDHWGLIHADLSSGNLLIHGDTLIPIDFSLSGFGFYLLDMSICLSNLKKPLRHIYLDGYGMALTAHQRHIIEACTIMMILVSALRHVTNPDWRSWFQRRFPVIAQHYCPMLIRGEEFLFEI